MAPRDRVDASQVEAHASADTCQEVSVEAQVTAPDVLIVLDRSGSMVGFGEDLGVDRWSPSRAAIASITAQFQELVAFGLSMFAAPDPSGIDLFSCAPGKVDVAPAAQSSAAIVRAIDGATPLGGATPTGATLEAVASVLGDRTGKPTGYVLLVTDGEPTCEEGPTESTPAAVNRANAAVDKLRAQNIKTYVIGFGTSRAVTVMDDFARRGGTEHYYPVESGAELSKEFARISSEVITCAYALEQAPKDRRRVEVKLDDAQLPLDAPDGHGFALEGTRVELKGDPCLHLKDGKPHQLTIRELCEDIQYL